MTGWIAEKHPHYAIIRAVDDHRRYFLFDSGALKETTWEALQPADAVEFTPGDSRGDKVVECHVTGRMFEPGTEGWA